MKTKDLMMSDFYWWEAEGKKYPLQVTKDTFKLEDEDIANFEPIPITEEFLEKNFELTSTATFNYFVVGSVKNKSMYKEYPYGIESRGDRYCFMRSELGHYWICDIKYVHELQRALRLVGLSEIANNLKV